MAKQSFYEKTPVKNSSTQIQSVKPCEILSICDNPRYGTISTFTPYIATILNYVIFVNNFFLNRVKVWQLVSMGHD
jgi:hypothetical protein